MRILMEEFVSEAIAPLSGGFDTAAMSTALPGLPRGFVWRDCEIAIARVLETWKFASREGSHAQGELYLRRHYFRLQMSNGTEWTVYFVRQTPRSGNPRRRWFLYSISSSESPGVGLDEPS